MKKVIIGSLIAVGLASGIAYAHGNNNWGNHMKGYGNHHYGMMGSGSMMGPGMMGGAAYDCPGSAWLGQDGTGSEVNPQFFEQTVELRKKMHDLRFEYMEAYRNPKTTQETLANLRQQMDDLRTQMYEISRGQQAQ